ncbi:IS110 family transposase [Hymenobacter artigasi]|uniref:Transposase n=2 Tax=Hymenobacter artigasi TaxID=2719616 RepID=A0ABX1HPA7_9BACT|nr:IS110 family transposase [Hymenobacter artigasi]NKI92082.1 transposase [Hymenobacter artigasi]
MYTHFLGLDVSKDTLDVALLSPQCQVLAQAQLANTPSALSQWLKAQAKQVPGFAVGTCLACLEHTGLYCRPALAALDQLALPTWLEHAAQIKVSMGQVRGKTDKADAVRIGQYAARYQDRVRLWQPARPVLVALDRLSARRARLVGLRQQLQAPLTGSAGFFTPAEQRVEQRAVAPTLRALTKAITAVAATMQQLIAADTDLAAVYECLLSVPGVGPVVATELLLTTGAFTTRSDAKRYASYAGVVPFERSSGQHRGRGRVSHHANKRVKALLHLAALSAVRWSKPLKAYYERKVAEGKPKLLVLNNVRNKLVHLLFACALNQRKYDEKYATALA